MKNLGLLLVVFAALVGLVALAGVEARADVDHPHGEQLMACAKACVDCQLQCSTCLDHCAGLLADGKKEHAKTMRTCADCADCCALAAKVTARGGPFAATACDACAKCCDDCAAACEKFPDDKHMAGCAKSCRDCAKACREMIKHLSH
jgi:hypothetical protein